MSIKSAPTSKSTHTTHSYSKRSSRTTSCTEGAFPPQPDTGRWSNKEAVNALAAENASTAPHLRRQAALTLFCKIEGEAWALALANAAKTWPFRHSTGRPLPQRGPPIEPVHPVPIVRDRFFLSGGVPPSRPLPSWSAARNLAEPSRRKSDTNVVSITVPQSEPICNHLGHWLTAMKHERVIILHLSDHQPSGPRVPAQLAQCAAARTRTALANPKPPADNFFF